jgi:pyruvate formate lyase activating enzyme
MAACRRCLPACPAGALAAGPDLKPTLQWDLCRRCQSFDCARACPAQSLIVYGQNRSVQEVLDLVEKDAVFYNRSGGGLTVSGGEPLMQPEFTLGLLRAAKKRRLKTAVETCGHVPWAVLSEGAGFIDALLYDVKSTDNLLHARLTGVGNELILDNLTRLLREFPNLPVKVRTPVVPGFNDTAAEAESIGRFLAGQRRVDYEALPYHRFGAQKYAFLGREKYADEPARPESAAECFQALVDSARQPGPCPPAGCGAAPSLKKARRKEL